MSMFSKALSAIGDFSNNLQLSAATSGPGRLWTEYAGAQPQNIVAKLEGAKYYGTKIPDSMIADQKAQALEQYTPLAQMMLKHVPIVMGDKPLPNVDLQGYDPNNPNSDQRYTAATMDPYVKTLGDPNPPHQRQIVLPQHMFTQERNQMIPEELKYEYAHALTLPMLPVGVDKMFNKDLEKMKETNPDMYASIKGSLSSFTPESKTQMQEALSLGAVRYGPKILDTPIGKYYKNLIKPDTGKQTDLFKNPIMNMLLGSAGNVMKDIVGGATAIPMNKRIEGMQSNASWYEAQAARTKDPQRKKYYLAQAQTNRDGIKEIADQVTGMFSPDVKGNPLLRGLSAGAEVAGTAGAISGIGSSVADAIAPQAAQDTSGMTIGQIQEASQRARGLGLLADYDEAAKSGSDSLMKQIAQQIVNSPQGSPYEAYKTVFQRLSGL